MSQHTITTEQLIYWAKAAHKKREDSWTERQVGDKIEESYQVSLDAAIRSTCPIPPQLREYFDVEFDLIKHMINTWWRELEEIDHA